jgi:exosortase
MMIRDSSGYSVLLWLGLPLLAALGLYAPLLPSLAHDWARFPSLSHGFIIPFIAGYLIWARRERLLSTAPAPSWWGLPVLVAGLGGLVLGIQGGEPFVARISMPVTLFGLALYLGGWPLTKVVWPGIAYLVFMIPLPFSTLALVTYRSRLVDAAVSTVALGWMGVPVNQDGVFLHLPNITLEVADDCSSIPAIAALLALGTAYASLTTRPAGLRATIILATMPLAIMANIVRITSTAAAAYYIGPWTLGTIYHMFNGTMNFILTFFFVLLLDAVLSRWVWRVQP